MPRGGARPGAGRKPGSLTRRTKEIQEAAGATGQLPIEYMLEVMRDTTADYSRRDDMAKAAAPYMHPRLQSITGKDGKDLIPQQPQSEPRQLARAIVAILNTAVASQSEEA